MSEVLKNRTDFVQLTKHAKPNLFSTLDRSTFSIQNYNDFSSNLDSMPKCDGDQRHLKDILGTNSTEKHLQSISKVWLHREIDSFPWHILTCS